MGFLRFLHADTLRTEHPLTPARLAACRAADAVELPKGRALPLPPAPPAELVLTKAPSMLPVSRLVFAESDAEADEFYSRGLHGAGPRVGPAALLHNGRPVCTVGCYEQSCDTESYMAAGVTDPAWQGRAGHGIWIVGWRMSWPPNARCGSPASRRCAAFYAQLGFYKSAKFNIILQIEYYMIEQFYDLRPEVLALDRKALDLCRAQFAHVEEIRDYNQLKMLRALHRLRRRGTPFLGSSGLRRRDDSRNKLEEVFARCIGPRPHWYARTMSGTHTLTVALFALLRTGNTPAGRHGPPFMTRWKASSASETRAGGCGTLRSLA